MKGLERFLWGFTALMTLGGLILFFLHTFVLLGGPLQEINAATAGLAMALIPYTLAMSVRMIRLNSELRAMERARTE